MRFLEDVDQGTSGTAMPSGGTVTGPVLSRRYATISWLHTEPEPAGALKAFEICLFTGTDAADTSSWIRPSETLGPAERSLQVVLELRTQITVMAGVRALYTDGNASAWVVSPAGGSFVPDTQTYGEQGSVKFPDGTIMQWIKSPPITGQAETTVNWPTPFPHGCYCVQVTTENSDGDQANDAWFQLRAKNASGCTIFRQSSNTTSDGKTNIAHLTAFGY